MANVGFQRYFTVDPGDDVLLEIEGVVIIDGEPPAPARAVGTGVVCVVAELEDGDFKDAQEVVSGDDFQTTFGVFGYTYNGLRAQNPCARTRRPDLAITPEYWNGNGAVAVSGKKFGRLLMCRVDTSVGAVQFTRCASLTGAAKFTYSLNDGDSLDTESPTPASTVFNGVAAEVTSVAATYAMTAGDLLTLEVDHRTFDVTFLGTDTTQGAVLARYNQFAGYNFATASGGQYKLHGLIPGTNGAVKVVSASSNGVLTALGLTLGETIGTGNVGDRTKITFDELTSLVEAQDPDITIEQLPNGAPRMFNSGNPGTGTLKVADTTTALAFGFPIDVQADAAVGNLGTIPAGTRVNNGSQFFVTMQTIQLSQQAVPGVAASGPGPYSTPIRHALDDGSGLAADAGSITTIFSPIQSDAFVCQNVIAVNAALTENQLDNAYLDALDSTVNSNTVAGEINIICCARQSNVVRQGIRQNVADATSSGLTGRVSTLRPPLGASKLAAESFVAEPGVGATAADRVFYNYPGTRTRIAAMASIGLAGGAGFTADGVIDVGSDTWLAALMSVLKPEENPGQDPTGPAPWMANALGLESSAAAQSLKLQDYKNFKAHGICAPRYNGGILFFQSGITSVNPAQYPGLVNIKRRRMADYLQDTLALICQKYVKQLSMRARRVALKSDITAFFESLLGRTNENQRRIAGYTVDDSVTSPAQLSKGLYRIITNGRLLQDFESITLMSTVGESVEVTILAPGESQ